MSDHPAEATGATVAPPRKALRAVFVEDRELDVELLLRELRRGGYDVQSKRVDTADALRTALGERSWDVVFSDWSMPQLDALSALEIVQERVPALPFIIVSGTVGEEIAVAAMRAGAHDYMAKDKLARLVPAIDRELTECAVRRERQKLQEQLVISDRMASVGTLAAGVAHEINNPLMVAIGNLELVTDDLEALADKVSASEVDRSILDALPGRVNDARDCLQHAREACERIRSIVRDLKIFSRSGDEERHGPVDVRRVLESSLRMAWNEIRHRASVVKDYGVVPAVQANESRLGQVFLNLIVNAAQSIPEGRADRNEVRVRTAMADGEHVLVEITDTGTGIAPADLKRVFDAFFTTKPVGVGTGLGLAICHRIVSSLCGEIGVQSELGKGTTFRVLLPVATTSTEPVAPPIPALVAVPARRGRVLVVDDDPEVASLVRRMLAFDHEVVAVERAQDALDRISAGELFDAIVCDLMMPYMTGMDLHVELSRITPQAASRMVFATGGAFTSAAREFLDRVPNPRLEKPFDARSLRFVIQSLIR